MRVKFSYKNISKDIELPTSLSNKDIKEMFPKVMQIQFDKNCRYEILDYAEVSEKEMLAYTE